MHWIVDAVLFPEVHGIITHYPVTQDVRGSLECLGTVLIKLVSKSRFSEMQVNLKPVCSVFCVHFCADFFVQMNELLDTYEPKIIKFLESIIEVPPVGTYFSNIIKPGMLRSPGRVHCLSVLPNIKF